MGRLMGLIISTVKNKLGSIFFSKPKVEDSPAYLHMTKMLTLLKYPKQRLRFYQYPKAKHSLTELIKRAKHFKNKTGELLFKDYLTELEMIEREKQERPLKLLKALVDAKYGQNNQNLTQQFDAFAEHHQHEKNLTASVTFENFDSVCAEQDQESTYAPFFTTNGEVTFNDDLETKVEIETEADFDTYDNPAVDLLCEQFNALSLERYDDDCLQPSKRQKTSNSKSPHLLCMNGVESMLFYEIWQAKKEIISICNTIDVQDFSTQFNELKRIRSI